MYLLNYDFHDMYALIIYFRNFPTHIRSCIQPIKDIISYMEAPMSGNVLETNMVRKLIRVHIEAKENGLEWAFVDNEYTANLTVMKKNSHYRLMVAIFKEMLDFCEDEHRMFLLCDATHNIPLVLANSYIKKPKKTIGTMIRDYQKQYNKEFLVKELKEFKSI